ncbi:MAG: extracellular solute-binding protein [Thermoguttaceae bacterium]
MTHTAHRPRTTTLCLLAAGLLLAGCTRSESDKKPLAATRPLEGVTLRLAVVDDPALAAAVIRLRGEWNAQTGANLDVVASSERDVLRADALPADAVLCPSHMLADLAESGRVMPVSGDIQRSKQWRGVFELLKLREAAWGRQTLAIPFGSPVFCCYYRADVLEAVGRRPPRTWAEYQELAALLAHEKPAGLKGPWCGAIEPLAPGWAGLALLARAAPSIKHRDNYSALFNIETMEPLISGPPMIEALEELVAAAKLGPAEPLSYDPSAVRAAFWRGECAMAITWPTAAGRTDAVVRGDKTSRSKPSATIPTTLDPKIRVGFVELPGSHRAFNLIAHTWDVRGEDDDTRVPLLAASGRLGVVSAKASNPIAAFQLLLWLSDERNSPQVSAASAATTLFRESNLKAPSRWVEKPVSAPAAVKYGDMAEAAFRHEQWLGALRLPGRAEYLAALDEAVASAIRGDKPAIEALLEADAKWRQITDRLGRDRQKAAYRHSLGLE